MFVAVYRNAEGLITYSHFAKGTTGIKPLVTFATERELVASGFPMVDVRRTDSYKVFKAREDWLDTFIKKAIAGAPDPNSHKTYEQWQREGRQVRKGERSTARDASGAAVFHVNQTDSRFQSDPNQMQPFETWTEPNGRVHPVYRPLTAAQAFSKVEEDPSAVRDREAMKNRKQAPVSQPRLTVDRPLCPVQKLTPINSWGRPSQFN